MSEENQEMDAIMSSGEIISCMMSDQFLQDTNTILDDLRVFRDPSIPDAPRGVFSITNLDHGLDMIKVIRDPNTMRHCNDANSLGHLVVQMSMFINGMVLLSMLNGLKNDALENMVSFSTNMSISLAHTKKQTDDFNRHVKIWNRLVREGREQSHEGVIAKMAMDQYSRFMPGFRGDNATPLQVRVLIDMNSGLLIRSISDIMVFPSVTLSFQMIFSEEGDRIMVQITGICMSGISYCLQYLPKAGYDKITNPTEKANSIPFEFVDPILKSELDIIRDHVREAWKSGKGVSEPKSLQVRDRMIHIMCKPDRKNPNAMDAIIINGKAEVTKDNDQTNFTMDLKDKW